MCLRYKEIVLLYSYFRFFLNVCRERKINEWILLNVFRKNFRFLLFYYGLID